MAESQREGIECDPETGAYRTSYRYPSKPPSIAVPMAVQTLTDHEMTDLDPIYDATCLDPDALNDLFRPTASDSSGDDEPRDADVEFTYHGFTVTVTGNGFVELQPRE
jgi:hypothetical protein